MDSTSTQNVRCDIPIDIRTYDDRQISRIRIHSLLVDPKDHKLRCLHRPWVRIEQLRITDLVEILREKGILKEGQDLFYQLQPPPGEEAQERRFVANDIQLQTAVMNHRDQTGLGYAANKPSTSVIETGPEDRLRCTL